MEKMPYTAELDTQMITTTTTTEVMTVSAHQTPEIVSTDWRNRLPVLTNRQVVLRELRASDATSLCALLTTE